jgi:choline-sulfatase
MNGFTSRHERDLRGRALPMFLLGLIWLLSCLIGCSSEEPDGHVILIIADTTRQDRLGCYGHADASTSTLDSLASGGVRFETVVTATPVTGPAIATILSGSPPPVHGMRDNARFTLNPELGLLAEVFAAAGYRTGAVVGAMPIHGRFGYDRGFQQYDDAFQDDTYPIYNPHFAAKTAALNESERRAFAVTDRALAWLADNAGSKPVFMLAHYFDAHGPYDPPPEYAARHRDAYDGEIAYMDDQIGRLLAGAREALGAQADIRVIVVGDHGEGLMDHAEATHGFFVYDTTVKVPLIFSGSGAAEGLVVEEPVRSLDIAATICSWVGLQPPKSNIGRDLVPTLVGGQVPAACDTAYVETFLTQFQHGWSPLQSVRTADWKWIMAPRQELYDLADDPHETTNVIDAHPDEVRVLREYMQDVLFTSLEQSRHVGASVNLADAELSRQLDALGYVGKTGDSGLAPDYTLPDPKDGVRAWNQEMERKSALSTARLMVQRGHPDRAYRLLTRAAGVSPLNAEEAALLTRVTEMLQAGRSR